MTDPAIDQRISELRSRLADLADVPERVDATNELAMEIRTAAPQEAMELCRSARDLAERLSYQRGVACSLRAIGSCHYFLGEYREAIDTSLAALARFEEMHDADGMVKAYNTLGNTYYRIDDYASAQEYNLKTLHLAQQQGNRLTEAGLLNNVGLVYMNMEDYPRALEYYAKSLDSYRELGEEEYFCNPLMNIGLVHRKLGQYQQAFDHLGQALELYQRFGDCFGETLCLGNLGTACSLSGDKERALDYLRRSLELALRHVNKFAEIESRTNLGQTLIELGRIDEGLAQLRIAQPMADEQQTLELQCQISWMLARAHRTNGDYQTACDDLDRHGDLEREMLRHKAEERMKGLQLSFEVERARKDAEIARLRNTELATARRDLTALAGSYDALTRANQELVELDRLKSEFMAAVSHELKTPLTAVCGYVDHLRSGRTGPLNERQQRALDSTTRSLKRLRRQITDLLDFSAIEAGKFSVAPEAFDLAELVAEIAAEERPTVEAKGLTLEISAPGPLPVAADRGRIGQVLENLIGNAVKFTSRGGLTVTARAGGDGLARVTVRDTGIGIAPEHLPQIFERFIQLDGSSTRRYGGVGLGLAIVKSILDAHHVPIRVESQQGKGTEFSFDLPLADSTLVTHGSK